MKKIITWVDVQGRYRVTSPAYGDLTAPPEETEVECIARTWAKLVEAMNPDGSSKYGIVITHPHQIVEDADQRAAIETCGGLTFRYGAIPRPNREGRRDHNGKIVLVRDARDGAWEMDLDGRPTVNMLKAMPVQMDRIRIERDKALEMESGSKDRQPAEIEALFTPERKARLQMLRDVPQNFKLSGATTPKELEALWPPEIPRPGS